MADDECDLETLSALLEENSEAGDDDSGQSHTPHSEAAEPKTWATGTTNQGSKQDGRSDDEADIDTLASMLEDDFEPEDDDGVDKNEASQEEVDPETIAAFFNDGSDSEDEDGPSRLRIAEEAQMEDNSEDLENCPGDDDSTSADGASAGDSQLDPTNVKVLQDELVMMQQRMMEIQKMLASQTGTPQASAAEKISPPVRKSPQSSGSSSQQSQVLKAAPGRKAEHAGKSSQPSRSSMQPASNSKSRSPTTSGSAQRPGLRILDDGDENLFLDNMKSAPSTQHPSPSTKRLGHFNSDRSSGKQNAAVCNKTFAGKCTDSKTSVSNSQTLKKERPTSMSSDVKLGLGQSSVSKSGSGNATKADRRVSMEANLNQMKRSHDGIKREQDENEQSVLARDIFGDGSDSDWEDMDGEKPSLSTEGREIKRLIHRGEKERKAHLPSYCSPSQGSSLALPSTSGGQAPRPAQKASERTTSSKTQASEQDDRNFIVEKKSNVRIANPLMSSTMLHTKMEGRKLIQLSVLHRKVNTTDVQGNWVTVGVIVHKSDTRKSSNGNTFCIMKLSDLQDTDRTVSFFLFGQTYKTLWKTDVGVVIGILNPDVMDPLEKNTSEVSFTVKNPAQVMLLGQSKDLGWCIGKTKRGSKCTRFINKKFGEYCEYHVKAAYKKTSAMRGELQGGCPGKKPRSLQEKVFGSKANAYKLHGQLFHTGSQKTDSNDKVTLAKLQEQQSKVMPGKVTTMSLQDLPPLSQDSLKNKLAKDDDGTFLELMSVPSRGSMNLMKHLVKKEVHQTAVKDKKGSPMIQSIQPSQLLKEHMKSLQELQQNREQKKSSAPVLGKGFYPGQEIDLFSAGNSPFSSKPKVSKSEIAKLKAIRKIQAKGGLEKQDPNAVKKASQNTDDVKKRVLDQIEGDSKKRKMSDDGSKASGSSAESDGGEAVPAKKKSRLLGDVDLNSEEIQQLLKAKSSHMGALAEAEAEKEEKYFDTLEKKEQMEEKMKTVTSLETTVYVCAECKYTALSVSDRCKQEGHKVAKHKGKKRFFECKKCKHRTMSLHRYPTEPCRNCGENAFEKTSMHKEKRGPQLESEILSIRGDEIKNLNSLSQKVYLNL